MSLWAIIPVKPLQHAKSRLSNVLTTDQRYQLAEAMFRHVLDVVSTAQLVTGVVVISRDTKALAIARDMGAKTIQESAVSDLNPALMRATAVVSSWRADAVLILPADLPFVNVDDIRGLIKLSAENSIVLSTDSEGDGTNALLVRPPGLIEYAYGRGSFLKHAQNAHRVGGKVVSYYSERLLLDIDYPEDLQNYHQILEQGRFGHLPTFAIGNDASQGAFK
jgi:2-phospho-L-lactate guanylyltransferase